MTDIVNWRFLLVLVIVLPCLAVQAHYFPKHGPLRHPRHGHEHGHKHGHPGRSLLMQEDGPMHYDKHGHDHWHKHGHKHGHPGRSLLMPEDGPMDYHKHGRDHWHKHGHKHKHGRPHGSGRSLLMQEDGSMDNDKHEHDEHEHHHDHKHDHDHDHKHHPKHLLLFAHEIKKNISEVQRGNKSKEEEFDRIRTVSAVLKEGKHNESKIVGSQVGIVVLGKEHFYTSFSYFLHGHGTIAVQGFVHGGKAKEAFLAVVGGTGEFFSVTGVDRAIFHHDKGVDVIIHHLTLDYPKHRA